MASPSLILPARVNKVSAAIVNSAMKVHSILGPGLLESAYQACLARELRNRGFHVETQLGLPVIYEGEKLDLGYRIDLLVENQVIVEIKCVEAIHPVHEAQLLSYLRLSKKNVGLLINFHVSQFERWDQANGRRLELGDVKRNNHGYTGLHGEGSSEFPCVTLCTPWSSALDLHLPPQLRPWVLGV